mmetsp:Transcript_122301/g.280192  ORF Transcript_122301/g.280192 Transcript_122301/m.280192 type:complete len:81 (-) Transcript_122301:157-399(-)
MRVSGSRRLDSYFTTAWGGEAAGGSCGAASWRFTHLCQAMRTTTMKAHHEAVMKQDPAYPDCKSWDEAIGKTLVGKKFHH